MRIRAPMGGYERLGLSGKPPVDCYRICRFRFVPLAELILILILLLCAGQRLEAGATENHEVAALQLPPEPSEADIWNARVFDEPLIPIGGKPSPEENRALAGALVAYSSRTNSDDFSALVQFLDSFPKSKWQGSLMLHLGVEYYNHGYYSKALEAWEQAWRVLQIVGDPKGKPQADRALGELARMYSKLGRTSELNSLLASVANRPLTGPGVQLIHSAQEAQWLMQNQPGICFRCGPLALDCILSDSEPAKGSNPLIAQSQSSTNGFSLYQVASLSKELAMNYQMAFRSPGAPWVLPAVIHWKVGHFAALLRRNGDHYLVKDHTFQNSLWVSAAALEEESSGYFLIPPGPIPTGWRAVHETESRNVWGRGQVSGSNPFCTQPCCIGLCSGGNSGAGPASCNSCSAPGGPPLTTYTFNTMLASLKLNDTPVGYKPPVGPRVNFTATYNQNEANQPATFYYSNLGPDWDCNWLAYIVDNPTNAGVGVMCYGPSGGTLTFTGYNSTNQTFAPELMTQAILVQTSSSSYELQFPDGSKKEFTRSDGSIGSSRRIFMTQLIDPAGNTATLNYNSSLRITNIVDAIGQSTTFYYNDAAYPYAITAVQDPFGRRASFQYNSQGLLSQITDVLSLESQYTYSSNNFISALTTPYGTNNFSNGTTNGTSWLQATDPLGESELLIAPLNPITSVFIDQAGTVPTNMPAALQNSYLNYRDTYYWSKQAYAIGAGNPSQATVYHFCHDVNTSIKSGILESVKKPLENRVWYNYPNQPSGSILGAQTIDRPSAVGRVLDDGSSQTYFYQYNAVGNLTNSTDPLGRNFSYIYATNGVDLLQVIMTSHGKGEVQSTMTYDSQHEPLTVTDASAQMTTNAYNARGQLLSTTDPLGEITTFFYDTNGYLLSITGPLQTTNDVTSFTYDVFGRVQTITDTEGYTLGYSYDAADRITNVLHPDGTSEQFVYSNLDLVASADRLGRWTTNTYDADRHLVQTQDPLGRATEYEYCVCGALEALFDPAGNATWWDHDVQGRITAKHYADGSTVNYGYESTTSRLRSRLDEKGQQTFYQYYGDNNLKSVDYPNAIVPTPKVSFTYDTNYNRVVTMQDGIGTTMYGYNPINPSPALGAGQLASVVGPLPNNAVTYQYDALGRATNRAINGVAEAATFDILSRPSVVTNALGTFQYIYVGATPRLASESYPNGQTNLYIYYDNIGDQRLLQIQHLYPNGSVLSAFGYSYNAVGQITSWTNQWDTLPTRVWFPSYDAVDELTNVAVIGGDSPVTNYSYSYDLAGNRTVASTNSVASQFYYNTLNQLIGSSVTLSNVSHEWDAEDRLTALTQGTNRTEIAYDGLGRRVEILEKRNGLVTTDRWFLWSGRSLCEERDTAGVAGLKRFFGLGVQLFDGTNITNCFYTRDHLRSVRELVNPLGLVSARYDYDPYGAICKLSGNLSSDFGFAGLYYHETSKASLPLHRAYIAEWGRWISRDPVGTAAGLNLYTYVGNDPINRTDASGDYWRNPQSEEPPVFDCEMICHLLVTASCATLNAWDEELGEIPCEIAIAPWCKRLCQPLPCPMSDNDPNTRLPVPPFRPGGFGHPYAENAM